MQIPLIGLLLLSTPWTGSWRLSLEDDEDIMHLVVKDQETVELYDSAWTPNEIAELRLDNEHLRIRATILGSAQSFILAGQRLDNQFSGSMTLKYPQFAVSKECKGKRVTPTPFPKPVDWIARYREEDRIDVVRFCVENAPRDSFESFQQFWDKEVQSNFYIFLEPYVAKTSGADAMKNQLKQLYANLDSYTKECVGFALEERLKKPAGSSDLVKSRNQVGTIDCVVLIPSVVSGEKIMKLSSIKNDVPPGVRPCCGESLYDMENFLVLPVTCQAIQEQATPLCGGDEPCPPAPASEEEVVADPIP